MRTALDPLDNRAAAPAGSVGPRRSWAAALGLLAVSCAIHWHGDQTVALPPPADLIVRNARLFDPVRGSVGTAIASRKGTIVALGREDEVRAYVGLTTRVMDAGGGTLVPGLVDAHGHLLELGFEMEKADLRGARSEEAMVARVEAFAKERTAGWILGRGWDQNLWSGGAFPTNERLNRAFPDRPVLLTRIDGHAALANAAALAEAGIGRETPDPAGGRIVRDAEGNATGLLVDAAVDLAARAVPAPAREDRERAYLTAQETCLALGLTAVHDAGLSMEDQAVLRKLDEEGKLRLRVYGMASADALPAAPHAGERFELRAVKAYADGALGSRGAALLEPYADDPENRGLVLADADELARLAEVCRARGLQLCTHAIGDRGVRTVLDAYATLEAAAPGAVREARCRIEHCQVVDRDDVARFAALGVVASMQPTHATSDGPWAPARLGAARMEGAYAWRRFLDAGVPLAFGSDFPVESADPRFGLYAAVTRRSPSHPEGHVFGPAEPLTEREALHAFTAGAAFASFHEGARGRLEVGFVADFTVFDREVLDPERPEAILSARVVWTVVGGAVAHPR